MEIKNCVACGKVFVSANVSMDVCPACLVEEQDMAERVISYLRQREGTILISEVCTHVNVKPSVLRRLQERGCLRDEEDIYYPCQTCEQPILEGRICKVCMEGLRNQVAQMEARDAEKARSNFLSQSSVGRIKK